MMLRHWSLCRAWILSPNLLKESFREGKFVGELGGVLSLFFYQIIIPTTLLTYLFGFSTLIYQMNCPTY